MNVRSSTSRVIESTNGPALFADDQGSEIPDSAEFYNFIVKTFLTKNSTADSTGNDTATTIFAPSVINNDTTWNQDVTITIFTPSVIGNDTWRKEDTTIAVYDASDKPFLLLNNYQNISEKF